MACKIGEPGENILCDCVVCVVLFVLRGLFDGRGVGRERLKKEKTSFTKLRGFLKKGNEIFTDGG